MKYVPNALTCSRVILGFGFPFLPSNLWLPVLLLALVTEYLDGFLARLYGYHSAFGQMMDPVADKIFVLSVAGTFLFYEFLTVVDLVLLSLRDIVVTIGVLAVLGARQRDLLKKMRPGYPGKIATTLQFFVLGSVALLQRLEPVIFYVTVAFSGIAAVDYIRRFWVEVVVNGRTNGRQRSCRMI